MPLCENPNSAPCDTVVVHGVKVSLTDGMVMLTDGMAYLSPLLQLRTEAPAGRQEGVHFSLGFFFVADSHSPNFTTKRHRTDRNRDTQTTERGHKHTEQATGEAGGLESPTKVLPHV